jgi:hypothetical protein
MPGRDENLGLGGGGGGPCTAFRACDTAELTDVLAFSLTAPIFDRIPDRAPPIPPAAAAPLLEEDGAEEADD